VLSLDVPDLNDTYTVHGLTETTPAGCTKEYGPVPALIVGDTLACSRSKDEKPACAVNKVYRIGKTFVVLLSRYS
jgi:hypothetical protein